MLKFKEGDKILQISAFPNAVCYTGGDKGPTVATVVKITPKMYRLDLEGDTLDFAIEQVELDFCMFSQERYDTLLEIYKELRDDWSKLYLLQLTYLREDHGRRVHTN